MKNYIILLLSICGALVNAQDLFSGTIYYEEATEKIPLEGANVYWLGTETGAVTNQNGKFSIPFSAKTKNMIENAILRAPIFNDFWYLFRTFSTKVFKGVQPHPKV